MHLSNKMTLYYLRLHFKDPKDWPLTIKLKLLLKLGSVVKRLREEFEAAPGELVLKVGERVNELFERWVGSGLIKDGYKFFEGDFVFFTEDLTRDQLNGLTKEFRKGLVDLFHEFLTRIKTDISIGFTGELIDGLMQFEVHRVLPARRALAAQLASFKREAAKHAQTRP
jgi:hypothetical protein